MSGATYEGMTIPPCICSELIDFRINILLTGYGGISVPLDMLCEKYIKNSIDFCVDELWYQAVGTYEKRGR